MEKALGVHLVRIIMNLNVDYEIDYGRDVTKN